MCVHVMCAHVYACMCMFVGMLFVYMHVYVCMYVCMYVCERVFVCV